MTIEKTIEDLVSSIKGKSMLCGWDVLVAYNETELNKLLDTAHKELDKYNAVTDVKQFQRSYEDPDTGDQKTLNYNLKLGSPAMSFLDTQKSIQLKYPLSGYTIGTTVTSKQRPLPAGLTMVIVTKLQNVHGDIKSGSTILTTNPNELVTFKNGETTDSHVVIDLTSPEVTIVNADSTLNTTWNATASTGLKSHITTLGVQYHLSSISQMIGSGAPASKLVPSQFIMSLVPGSSTEPSALLTWISVQGMPFSGQLDTPNSPLLFKPDGTSQILPIPKGNTAAIYISRDAFYDRMIKSYLEGAKFTNVSLQAKTDASDGITVTASPPSSTVTVADWNPDGTDNQREGNRHCQGFSFDMNSASLTFKINKTDSKFSINKSVRDVKFSRIRWKLSSGGDGGTYRDDDEGKATFKLTADGSATWSNEGGGEKAALKFTLPSTFSVDTQNQDNPGLMSQLFAGAISGTLAGMNSISVSVPAFSFDFGSIDYFLETNLLFPGKHIFKSGAIPSDLYIPHDLLITGSLEDKIKA